MLKLSIFVEISNKVIERNFCRAFVTQFSAREDESLNEIPYDQAKPFDEIPGPKGIDRKLLPGGELFGKPLVDIHRYFNQKYGDVVRLPGFLGRPSFVLLYNPTMFAKAFRTEGQWPERYNLGTLVYHRTNRHQNVYKNYKGLIVDNEEPWQKFRTIVNPVMMQPKTVSLYVERIDQVTREFIYVVRNERDDKNETPPDFGNYIQRWALESIGEIALDTRFNVLKKESNNELPRLVDEFFALSYELEVKPSLWRYIKTPKFNKMMKVLDNLTEITLRYVEEAREKIQKQSITKPDDEQGLLEKLLKADKEIAVIMAMDMLIVGIDTTSAAVKALFYLLAKHPDKQKKLREELLTILPSKDTPLTAEKMKHLPYLRACMKEAHRLIPVTVGNSRKAGQDIVLGGYQIPKGTSLALSSQLLMKNEKHFARASEFIPERWLKDDSYAKAENCPHAKETHPFVYLPFGFGARTCIGRRFAELETAIFITRFYREFDISWHYEDLKIKSTVVDTLNGPMKFRLNDLSN